MQNGSDFFCRMGTHVDHPAKHEPRRYQCRKIHPIKRERALHRGVVVEVTDEESGFSEDDRIISVHLEYIGVRADTEVRSEIHEIERAKLGGGSSSVEDRVVGGEVDECRATI